jgi:hypothetical protein
MSPRLVELYKQSKFPVDKLSKVYPAEQLDQALEDLKTGKVRWMFSLYIALRGREYIFHDFKVTNRWHVGD